MKTSEELELWRDLVVRVARFVASDFPYVEREDLEQELYLFLFSRDTMDDPETPGSSMILTKVAKTYAFAIRAQHLYQTSQYSYRPSDIRLILESVFDYRDWTGGYVPNDARGDDWDSYLDVYSDVHWGFQRLSETYRQVIISRYRDRVIPPPASNERRQLSRALRRLTDIINNYWTPKQGPGARRVKGNAKSTHDISRNNGD